MSGKTSIGDGNGASFLFARTRRMDSWRLLTRNKAISRRKWTRKSKQIGHNTIPSRSLIRQPRYAIFSQIKNSTSHQFPTRRPNFGEVIIRQRKILQISQFTDHLRHLPVEEVSGEVQLLNHLQAAERARQWTRQQVLAGVKHGGRFQEPHFVWNTPSELIAQ